MPFSSGNYSAPSSPGAFNPAISGQSATPTAWNLLLADIATALSTAILKDGTQTIAQNIPWNNKKITGLGNATLATDAVNAGQVVGGTLSGVNDTGAADAYVIAPGIAITSYAAYQSFQFKAANTNTGASTLAVSSLAVKSIKHLDGTALLAGDIVAGEIVDVTYDGTNFQLLSSTGMRGTANTWRAAQTLNAALTYGGVTLANAVTGTGAMVLAVAPALTGAPTAPTAAAGTNTTQIATTAFVTLQTVSSAVTTSSSASGNIPYDDTIPASSEGDLIMTQIITPRSTTSVLTVNVAVMVTGSTAMGFSLALFKDAETDTRKATAAVISELGTYTCVLTYSMVSGTTSPITFSVRGGGGATWYLNGNGGGRIFGGVGGSNIIVTETA